MNLPAEAMEMEAPIRVHRVALRPDSGGPGRQRGGLGIVKEYEVLDGEVRFTHRGERHMCAAQGMVAVNPAPWPISEIMRAVRRRERHPVEDDGGVAERRPRCDHDRRRRRQRGEQTNATRHAAKLDLLDGKVSAPSS